jgi:hypothetical protein
MHTTYFVHYIGQPRFRRMLIERSDDNKYWGGDTWVEEVGDAVLYKSLEDAHWDANEFQRREIDGLARRELTCELRVVVCGEAGTTVRVEDVIAYLRKQMQITIDYEGVEADSPLADCHVRCEVKVAGLKDKRSRRRKT